MKKKIALYRRAAEIVQAQMSSGVCHAIDLASDDGNDRLIAEAQDEFNEMYSEGLGGWYFECEAGVWCIPVEVADAHRVIALLFLVAMLENP